MNDFEITINDPERAAEYLKVLGRTTVKIKSPIPKWGNFPDVGRQQFYELDLDEISEEELEKIIKHIADKFELTEDLVRVELPKIGVPVLAKDCTVTVFNPQRWF